MQTDTNDIFNDGILGNNIGDLAFNVLLIAKEIGVEHAKCVKLFIEIITNEISFDIDRVGKEEIKENIKGLILEELSIDEYIGFINYKGY
jgi:hypothetical protein